MKLSESAEHFGTIALRLCVFSFREAISRNRTFLEYTPCPFAIEMSAKDMKITLFKT